ncbi:MAG: macro domain-containing protein [Planctomycetota bacterium]
MQWIVKRGDILDEPVDVLICSANPFLTLSGGVGGALLQRYGDHLRIELEEVLKSRSVNYVDRGSVIVTFPSDTPYKSIIHAVAVDGMYESSSQVITSVVRQSLHHAMDEGATDVALTALGTGYGRLSPQAFAVGVKELCDEVFSPIERITIVIKTAEEAENIRQTLEYCQ